MQNAQKKRRDVDANNAEIAKIDAEIQRAQSVIEAGDAAAEKVNKLRARRDAEIGMAFTEHRKLATAKLDTEIAAIEGGEALAQAAAGRAALPILEKRRAAFVEQQQAAVSVWKGAALDTIGERCTAAVRKYHQALDVIGEAVTDLATLEAARQRLGGHGIDHSEQALRDVESLRTLGERVPDKVSPAWLDALRRNRSDVVKDAVTALLEEAGQPTAQKCPEKPVKPEISAPKATFSGNPLPEGFADPKPDLPWPAAGATMLKWATAFVRHGICVTRIDPRDRQAKDWGKSHGVEPWVMSAWQEKPESLIGFVMRKPNEYHIDHHFIFDGRSTAPYVEIRRIGRVA